MTANGVDGTRTVEVACDESGSDGENLTGGNTDVFAHASVCLPQDAAAGCLREIRGRIRSPAEEYKANHLLREKHRAVLEWLLAPAGPVHGHAHVHLTEKAYFVVEQTVGLLLTEDGGDGAATDATALYRTGPAAFGPDRWREFLAASNRLLRVRNSSAGSPVDAFFRTVDELRPARPRTPATEVLERLAERRDRADAYRARVTESPVLVPPLNPLLPAVVRTAAHWSAGGARVSLVHDRQNMLTPERIAWIEESARREGIALTGVRLVESRRDARVQIADFLAGIARKIASDELNGRGDAVLTGLLRPYVGAGSVWGDDGSRSRLGAGATVTVPAPGVGTGL
ncbi:hypothetical protein AB0F77_18660 [Streptomyces sp. NPDC026672]|uniref:hypothetical protein n=1 Tax=unclassified Streptomyces TaxID=2593676 RepID=UPI0033D68D82